MGLVATRRRVKLSPVAGTVLSRRSGRFIQRLLPTTTQRVCALRRTLGPAECKRSVNRDCARLFTAFFLPGAPAHGACVRPSSDDRSHPSFRSQSHQTSDLSRQRWRASTFLLGGRLGPHSE